MIKSFRSADTRRLFETGKSKRFGAILTAVTRKLTQLDAAATLEFLQWRICFRWTAAGPEDVEIADDH